MINKESIEPDHNEEELIEGYYKVRPNKSQIKRDLAVIFDLAQELINITPDQLKQIPLDDKLLSEIQVARRLKSGDAKKRQTQYVAKLMRKMDLSDIKAKLNSFENASKEQTAYMHQLENLRDQLLDNDDALTKVLEVYEVPDIQQLRNSIRAARKEAADNLEHPDQDPKRKHYRELFQLLKDISPKETQ